MKSRPLFLTLISAAVIALFAGCSLMDTIIPKNHTLVQAATVSTNYVPVSTNVQTQISFLTNQLTGTVTQNQLQVTNVMTSMIVTTNPPVYVDLADTSRVETGVKAIGGTAGAIGVPFAGAAATALALLVHVGNMFWNARKIKKIQDGHVTALATVQLATETLVQNIQHIRDTFSECIPGYTKPGADGKSLDDKIVAGLNFAQTKAGPEVKAIIEQILGDHKDAVAKVEGYIDAFIPPAQAPAKPATATAA